MSSHNTSKQANKDEDQSMGGGGGGGSNGQNTSSLRPPEQILKCPRCDSPNTKFCYYNNYSLAQPRHFCKDCRRYWTKGGALRNVPIGGSCRKNKKTRSCSSSNIGWKKFFGHSTLDFQLGGLNIPPRVTNQFSSSYGDASTNHSSVNHDPLGYNNSNNLPFSSSQIVMKDNQNGGELGRFHHHNTHIASSIESLSSINQDLHWKLQQQRLSMLFGGSEKKKQVVLEPHHQKPQPILFHNLETSKPAQSSMDGCGLATEWFFDNRIGAGNDDQNASMDNWNGIQSWNHLNPYS